MLVVIRTEQPEAAARTADDDITGIGIRANVAGNIIPVGLIAPAARVTRIIAAALGPALVPVRPSPLRRGALHVRIPGLGIGVIR
jgi:hypothetical protein